MVLYRETPRGLLWREGGEYNFGQDGICGIVGTSGSPSIVRNGDLYPGAVEGFGHHLHAVYQSETDL